MASQKRARRASNWSLEEKELLQECVCKHLPVIESKENNSDMIRRKDIAWMIIRNNMLACGYDRSVTRLKQQWMRIKMSSRSTEVPDPMEPAAATSPGLLEQLDGTSYIIKEEFIEDGIELRSSSGADKSAISSACTPKNTATSANTGDPTAASKTSCSASLERLRILATKTNPIEEKNRQLAKEGIHSEEIHLLRVKKLTDEIAQERRLRQIREAQLVELHNENLELVREQIRHQRIVNEAETQRMKQLEELHLLKLEVLRAQHQAEKAKIEL